MSFIKRKMSGITNELDNLAKSLKLYRFKGELNFYQSQNDNKYSDKINQLIKIIDNLEDSQCTEDISRNKILNVFDEINKMTYMKPWKKLPDFHKNVKIKEYLDEKYKDNKNDRNTIEGLLTVAIENKELNKDEYVTYDISLCKITDIPVLKKNENLFKLEFPSKKIKKII